MLRRAPAGHSVPGVTRERLKSPRLRLFVALDLPDALRAAIGSWGAEALRDPALRPVPAENLHVTLAFLGFRPRKEVEEIAAAVRESAGPAPLVELLGAVPRPPRGRPRLYALEALSPGAELLRESLVERLVAGGFHRPEKRPFWPHVTVARVRPQGRGSRRPATVAAPPGELPAGLRQPFYGVRLTLYRSELQPSGARYAPLAQIELPGAGRQ